MYFVILIVLTSLSVQRKPYSYMLLFVVKRLSEVLECIGMVIY